MQAVQPAGRLARQARPRVGTSFASLLLPANRGDDMKSSRTPSRLLIAGAIAAVLPLTAAFAQQSQPPKQGVTFESLDTDGDGRISKTEAAVNDEVTVQFSRYDKNGDGYIAKDEVTSANSPPPEPNPQ
jgi:hypothetical protein